VGNGTTFPQNLTRWEEVCTGLSVLADSVAARMRRQGLYCGGVQVTIRDAQFKTITRQKRLNESTHLMKDILQAAMELTQAAWKAPTPIRMLTVTALHITEEADSYQQLDLLGAQQTQRSEKQEKLELAMDAIRGKYGKGAISFGSNGGKQIGWDD
jgi:DNA polymerase-4